MLKKLLLVGAVIALVPMDRQNQQALYDVARATFNDIAGFCSRNRDVCDRSSIVVGQFTAKAKFAGGLVYDIVKDSTSLGDDPLGRYVERPSPAYRSIDSDPGPVSGDDRLPAYSERRVSDGGYYGAGREGAAQPAWRGARY